MFLIHCNACSIAMYSIISINIGPILAVGTGPWILPIGASVKRLRSTACSGAGGGGVLRAKRSRSTVCFGARGGRVLQVTWSRSMVCSRAGGGDVLWAKRSRVKQSSGVDGEAVEAMACSEGALCTRRRALSVGDVEDLKCTSGENLLSVERATRVPDIYVGGQMHDAHSLWHITYFFRHVAHYF
jgi:hypothetical protein